MHRNGSPRRSSSYDQTTELRPFTTEDHDFLTEVTKEIGPVLEKHS